MPITTTKSPSILDDPRLIVPVTQPKKSATPAQIAALMAEKAHLADGVDHINTDSVLEFLAECDPAIPVAFDTETDYNPRAKSTLLGQKSLRFIQLCQWRNGKAHTVFTRVNHTNVQALANGLRPLLLDPDRQIIIHNSGFDGWVVRQFLGYSLKCRVWDTLTMSRFWYLGYPPNWPHTLGAVAQRELGVTLDKSEQSSLWRLPVSQDQIEYMIRDVQYLHPIRDAFLLKLREEPNKSIGEQMALELKFQEVCRHINQQGMRVDLPYLERLVAENDAKLEPLSDKLALAAMARGVTCQKHQVACAEIENKLTQEQHKLTELNAHNAAALNDATLKFKSVVATQNRINALKSLLTQPAPEFNPGSVPQKKALLATYRQDIYEFFYANAGTLLKAENTLLKEILAGLLRDEDADLSEAEQEELDLEADLSQAVRGLMRRIDLDTLNREALLDRLTGLVSEERLANWTTDKDLRDGYHRIAHKLASDQSAQLTRDAKAGTLKRVQGILNLPKDSPLGLVLEITKIKKQSSMLHAYLELAKASPAGDRLHSVFNSLAAKTGRVGSVAPNVQNIDRKKEIRKAFIATEGWTLAVCDFSQIEARVMAYLADETNMLAAFADDRDLHTTTALLIWKAEITEILDQHGVPWTEENLYHRVFYFFDDEDILSPAEKKIAELIKPFRQLAKSANFGLIFGAGWRGLAAYIFNSSGKVVSEAVARQLRLDFFTAYPKLAQFHRRIQQQMDAAPDCIMIAGRVRRWTLPTWCWESKREVPCKDLRLTVGANTPVQGLAAIIAKMALVAVYEAIKDGRLPGVRIVNQVHDEGVFELRNDCHVSREDRLALIKQLMESAGQHLVQNVQIKVSAGLCLASGTWGDK